MNKGIVQITITGILLVGLTACQKRDERGAAKPPQNSGQPQTPPAPQPQQGPDLISKDNDNRNAKRDQIVSANPNISTAPLLKKPRLDDIITTSFQAKVEKGSIIDSKFVIVLKTSTEQALALNFSSDKKLVAQGSYQRLTALDKAQKIITEARCLASCDDVFVRVRRNNGEESALVFKLNKEGVGELTMFPGLEKDPSTQRVFDMARVVELSYPIAAKLESVLKTSVNSKSVIEKLAAANEAQGTDGAAVNELRRSSGLLESVRAEIDVALNEAYSLTALSLKSAGHKVMVSPEQLTAIDKRLMTASQHVAIATGIVNNQVASGKVKSLVEGQTSVQGALDSDLRGIQDLINSAREKLPLMTQLIGKLGN